MESNRACLLLCLFLSASFFTHCVVDARKQMGFGRESKKQQHPKKVIINAVKHTSLLEKMMTQLNLAQPLDYSSNTQPNGVSTTLTLPPYVSLPPLSVPQNAPPFCVNPPNTPANSPPGPITLPSPPYSSSNPNSNPNPPESSSNPNPNPNPNPPESSSPNPPETVPSPPEPGYTPSPPYYEPGPSTPTNTPTPSGGSIPSPTSGFLPPVVFPPPMVPPPASETPTSAYWCVAKPSVPDPIIQEAMNFACGSGADCHSIQPNGPCFKPNTLWAHASYAFNSYWQRTKNAGGSCTFGGTGMLVTVDPSYNGCHFDFF